MAKTAEGKGRGMGTENQVPRVAVGAGFGKEFGAARISGFTLEGKS